MKKVLLWLLRQLTFLVKYRNKDHFHFSFGGFITSYTVMSLLMTAGIMWAYSHASPTIYEAQSNSPWYWRVSFFVLAHFCLSLFEWVYHRYVLHRSLSPLLDSQYREHTHHHMLTRPAKGAYPILGPEQIESSTFPFYALIIFWAIFGVFIGIVQAILPTLPILLYSLFAVTASLMLYEIYHAVMHNDYDWWMAKIKKYPFLRRSYCFHLMHHQHNRVNEAISGFFLIAFWDRVFGTYCKTVGLPTRTGEFAVKPVVPKPRKLTAKIDDWADDVHDARKGKKAA